MGDVMCGMGRCDMWKMLWDPNESCVVWKKRCRPGEEEAAWKVV
jgi:hypothetical protein